MVSNRIIFIIFMICIISGFVKASSSVDWNEEGRTAIQKGDYEQAIEYFNQAIFAGIDLPVAYNNKGVALFRLGKCDDSVKTLNIAKILNPDLPDTYINLALAQLCEGNRSAAYQTLNHGINSSDNQFGILLMRAKMRVEDSLYADAKLDYGSLISLDPYNADLWCDMSNLLFEMKDYQGAYDAINESINLSNEDPILYYNKGVIEEQLSQLRNALASYERSISLDPSNIKPHFNKGAIYWNHHRLNESEEAFSMVVELDPSFSEGWFFLGLVQKELGKVNESTYSFTQAASLDPTNKIYGAYAERYQTLPADMRKRPIPLSMLTTVVGVLFFFMCGGKLRDQKN